MLVRLHPCRPYGLLRGGIRCAVEFDIPLNDGSFRDGPRIRVEVWRRWPWRDNNNTIVLMCLLCVQRSSMYIASTRIHHQKICSTAVLLDFVANYLPSFNYEHDIYVVVWRKGLAEYENTRICRTSIDGGDIKVSDGTIVGYQGTL